MEDYTKIFAYGKLWNKQDSIRESFDWNDILAGNKYFQRSGSNPKVLTFSPEGKILGNIYANGREISFHVMCKNELLAECLEEALSEYFHAAAAVTMSESKQDLKVYLYTDDGEEHLGIKAGDRLKLGMWPQGPHGEEHPIVWRVLAVNGDEAMLLSERCLMLSGYCDKNKGCGNPWYLMWGNSLAREMCNGFFCHRMPAELKPIISQQEISTVDSGPLCRDEVFLLSEGQVRLFMPAEEERRAQPTEYLLSDKDKIKASIENVNGTDFIPWWIMPEEIGSTIYPKAVLGDGRIFYHGRFGYYDKYTIRPAVCVRLSERLRELLDSAEGRKVSGGKAYSLEYVKSREGQIRENRPGGRSSRHDVSLHKWRMQIQLDNEGIWFLSVFVHDNGAFDKYCLDCELASDSHYEFSDERAVRKAVYRKGDENMYLAEVFIRVVKQYGGDSLLSAIKPYLTAQFHFD